MSVNSAPVSESVRFARRKLEVLRESQSVQPERIGHFRALLKGINKGVEEGRFSLEDVGTSFEEFNLLQKRLYS